MINDQLFSFENEEPTDAMYLRIKDKYERDGIANELFYKGQQFKVYSPLLFFIFRMYKPIKVNDLLKPITGGLAGYVGEGENKTLVHFTAYEQKEINGKEYIDTYIEGYKEGEQYFETEFKVSPNILYGENAKQYVSDIKHRYYGNENERGWQYVKTFIPTELDHQTINMMGYYSGILNKVEDIKPRAFNSSFDGFLIASDTDIKDYIGLDFDSLTNFQKRGISILLIGLNQKLNEVGTTIPQLHHLESAINKLRITPKQAIKILHATRGSYSHEKQPIIDSIVTYLKDCDFSTPPQTETEQEQKIIEIKPVFRPQAIEQIFDLVKIHFKPEHQTKLKQIIESGGNSTEPLLFNGNGKTFLDFLKQLMEGQFLTIAVQKELEAWVVKNFKYLHNGHAKTFTPKYTSTIISGNTRAAKGNRLIDIKSVDNKFEIIQLQIKNRQK
jgi:hypothetical protein